ncbi:hypothetical protein EDWATA_01983 [Edwardsiella tarda ATCC 23685]|uniref:Uncharacterized protein n=1 Tax=Edwardsiella tarda ATCC 23685 TaxID=500638 RepID=D4F5F5_EDWTA|nr:hypothetical protein EDWATA_01983 [Edwardsiella tarda ATCC 23685]
MPARIVPARLASRDVARLTPIMAAGWRRRERQGVVWGQREH